MTRFRSLGQMASSAPSQRIDVGTVWGDVSLGGFAGPDLWSVWESQPSIRKVTSFIASNIASIPLHVFNRASDTDRKRVTDGPVADVLAHTMRARGVTPMRFWERVILDGLLYDRWAVLVVADPAEPELIRVPPRRFRLVTDELDRVQAVRIFGERGVQRDLDPASFLLDVGYSQHSGQGTSPIMTLRALLGEVDAARDYRRKVMRAAAQHTGVVERAQPWSSAQARDNFLESLRAFNPDGGRAGATMLLDEDMHWKDRTFKPTDIGDLDMRRLTDVEVASAYHIPPELLGIREGNYSNLEAMRQALYRDHLGPYIASWEQAVAPVVDMLEPGSGIYIEAAVESKLRGSFEESARVLQTSTGAPWLTRNEARARQNLPAVDGGDELVTPLNVLIGGQASPTDSGTQNQRAMGQPSVKSGGVQVKSVDLEDGWVEKARSVLAAHYARQSRTVMTALGAKSDGDWWDGERWNRELSEDLYRLAATCVDQMGAETVRRLGFDPDESWDAPRTLAYLRAVTKARASWVNDATKRRIDAALAEGGVEAVGPVFESSMTQRSEAGGRAFIAAMAGFAVIEAGKQAAPGRTRKTWITGKNPRPSHQAMNGETVPTGADFSNGMSWPGDPAGGADEVAGCNCSVMVETTAIPLS